MWQDILMMPRFRAGESVQGVYFVYVAILAIWFPLPENRRLLAASYAMAVWLAFRLVAHPIARDWLALFFTLLAYRQMDWFTPEHHTHALENSWIAWDRQLLPAIQNVIESAGSLGPAILECAYLVVYAAGPAAVAVLYLCRRPDRTWIVLLYYTLGTLLSYGCFPFFPSEPPRTVFPDQDLPNIITAVRRWNLAVLGGAGIHSSVFPSAHVSSAFSAAFGMFAALPEKRWIGASLTAYAALVAIATVYGRYHYAVDAAAGFGVALAAAGLSRLIQRRSS